MSEEKKAEPPVIMYEADDEIDLLELARTIWKGKKLIIWIVAVCTLATIILSLVMTNIYTAQAVIKPVLPDRATSRFATGVTIVDWPAWPASACRHLRRRKQQPAQVKCFEKEMIEHYPHTFFQTVGCG